MFETTRGLRLVGDVDDPRRADLGAVRRGDELSLVVLENSSISTRYGWPPIVTGIAICGIVSVGHVSRLTSRTCGFGLRAWISLTSRMISAGRGAATYSAVAVVADRQPVRAVVADATAASAASGR